jgi:hypothetical protein
LPSITCCNMFPLTPLLYINICSSSCISWFHPKSTVFNVLSYLYLNLIFFTKRPYEGIQQDRAPRRTPTSSRHKPR